MIEEIFINVTNQLTPELIVELLITFIIVFLIVFVFKSDLTKNKVKKNDPNEEKRQKSIDAIKKTTERVNSERKLKNKLQARGKK